MWAKILKKAPSARIAFGTTSKRNLEMVRQLDTTNRRKLDALLANLYELTADDYLVEWEVYSNSLGVIAAVPGWTRADARESLKRAKGARFPKQIRITATRDREADEDLIDQILAIASTLKIAINDNVAEPVSARRIFLEFV